LEIAQKGEPEAEKEKENYYPNPNHRFSPRGGKGKNRGEAGEKRGEVKFKGQFERPPVWKFQKFTLHPLPFSLGGEKLVTLPQNIPHFHLLFLVEVFESVGGKEEDY
jgi:hypothetical protein